MKHISVLAALFFLATACSGGDGAAQADQSQAAAASSDVDRAVAAAKIANAIAANPAAADSILRAARYTEDSFQRLMYEIAADSVRAAAYSAARRD